ncbi:MAG: lysine--tRNA ligase [Candidatus Lokiarchaeota archaeon]|nr:lysine--tRNA ligase [Candidatus Lokiarchaeota archaeon]
MNKEFQIHWLEEIAEEIINRSVKDITLSTGKTPSGHIHLGILREILICDALRRILENRGYNVKNILFFDSLDAAKRFPIYIPKDFQKKHIGKPFALIPCPFKSCKCESYAHHFGNELSKTFPKFGIKLKILWTHELYKQRKMQEYIKIALENNELIKNILKKYILPTLDDINKDKFNKMQKSWMPAMVICEKCNRIQSKDKAGNIVPNRVQKYNKKEETVSYNCEYCEYSGDVSIWGGRLKLNWRIDWPAKWAMLKTTCEPAGKDHSVRGGAYDTGLELCQKLYEYEGPVKVSYEWLRLGNYDMKTSKGIVFTPEKYLNMAEPEIYRAIILKTNPNKHIAFRIEELSQYYDYYEKMENVYFGLIKLDDEAKNKFLKYTYPLTHVKEIPKIKPQRLSLKLLSFLTQIQNIIPEDILYKQSIKYMKDHNFDKIISADEFKILLERSYHWIEEVKKIIEETSDIKTKKEIMRKLDLFSIPIKIDNEILDRIQDNQKLGIRMFRQFLIKNENLNADGIQNKIFTIASEELKISPKKLFEAIYLIIFGKKNGPRLGSFLSMLDKEWLLKRLNI